MGVLACDRRGCENVMCDRHSHTYGYICNECFEELVDEGIAMDIERFMNTEKDEDYPVRSSEDFYEEVFRWIE